MTAPTFTFGIEEEYHVVDLATRELASVPEEMMRDCEAALGEQVAPEFFRSQIEVGTKVCTSVAEARGELAHLRRTIARTARGFGLAPIAAGTHPATRKETLVTSTKERYQLLARDLAGVGRRMAISGMHVHVGIEDDQLRIDLMNQARYFLPHLLMLSTSSPFWQGEDTGLKSYRLAITDEMPRTGLPGFFASHDEYARTIDVLVRAGVIEDATKVWWDLRPSARFHTLEMRITDVCPRLDDAVSIGALFVAILRMLYRLRRSNLRWRNYPVFLLNENRWRAQRYGVVGTLFDFGKGTLVPFRQLMDELLTLIAEDAAEMGAEAEIAHARRIVAEGTSADRQLATFAALRGKNATPQEAIRGVVDQLIAETVEGTDLPA